MIAAPIAAPMSVRATAASRPSGLRGHALGIRAKASSDPAAHSTQLTRVSTSPALIRCAPSAMANPASENISPKVTTLTPVASSTPVRCPVPPRTIRTAPTAQAAR